MFDRIGKFLFVFVVAWVTVFCVLVLALQIRDHHPPAWLFDASGTFLDHVAEPMYWFLALISLLAYLILLRQKRPRETYAAKALRWFQPAKVVVWLAFALRGSIGEWQLIAFAFATVYVAVMGSWWLIALYLTYIRPARRRHVAVGSDVLPSNTGTERRSRWRKISE